MKLAGGIFPLDQMYSDVWKGDNFNPMLKCLRNKHVLTKSHKCCVDKDRCERACFIDLHYFFCQAPLRDDKGKLLRDETDRVICCWEKVGVKCQEGCWLHKYNNGEYVNGKFYHYNKEFKRVFEGATVATLKDEYWPWYLNRSDGTYNYGRPEIDPEPQAVPAPMRMPSKAQPTYNQETLETIVLSFATAQKQPGKVNVHELRKAATYSIMQAFPHMSEKQAEAVFKGTYDAVKHADMIANQKASKDAAWEHGRKKAEKKEQKRIKLQEHNELLRQGHWRRK